MNDKSIFLIGFVAGKHAIAGADAPIVFPGRYNQKDFISGLIAAFATDNYLPAGQKDGFVERELGLVDTLSFLTTGQATLYIQPPILLALNSSASVSFSEAANAIKIFPVELNSNSMLSIGIDGTADAPEIVKVKPLMSRMVTALVYDEIANALKIITKPLRNNEHVQIVYDIEAQAVILSAIRLNMSDTTSFDVTVEAAAQILVTKPIASISADTFDLIEEAQARTLLTKSIASSSSALFQITPEALIVILKTIAIRSNSATSITLQYEAEIKKLLAKRIQVIDADTISFVLQQADAKKLLAHKIQISDVIPSTLFSGNADLDIIQVLEYAFSEILTINLNEEATLTLQEIVPLAQSSIISSVFTETASISQITYNPPLALAGFIGYEFLEYATADVIELVNFELISNTGEVFSQIADCSVTAVRPLAISESIIFEPQGTATLTIEPPVPPPSDWVIVEGTNLHILRTYYNWQDNSNVLIDQAYYENPIQSGTNLHITSEGYNDYGVGDNQNGD